MKKALSNIRSNSGLVRVLSKNSIQDEFEINSSHIYIRFSPQTKEQENILLADTSIYFFDYPLDYKFNEGFLENRPELPEGKYPEYWTSLKIGKSLPLDVPYEIIDELYIPEVDPIFNSEEDLEIGNNSVSGQLSEKEFLLRQLILEAFTLTGNQEELLGGISPESTNKTDFLWIFGNKWTPSGNIMVHDNVLDKNIPVVGAQILMRQWFTVDKGYTDSKGNFKTGTVRGKATYLIQWEREDYSIRNGAFFQAELYGPNKEDQAWNKIIGKEDNEDFYHAHIHQAAHDFYYGYRFDLNSPPRKGYFYNFGVNQKPQPQIKIAARKQDHLGFGSSYSHSRSDLSLFLTENLLGIPINFFAQIHIKAYKQPSDLIYGTTIHELAHAAHSVVDRKNYDNLVRDAYFHPSTTINNRNKRLLETWPRTVEIMMTKYRYINI